MEFISALAAGNGAKLMVEVASQGITPLTVALAVAAKQTGGQLVCILPDHHDYIQRSCIQLEEYDLRDAIQIVVGNPIEVFKQYRKVDFIVIDSKFADEYSGIWETIDFSPKGSVIIVSNLLGGRKSVPFGEIFKRKEGIHCVTLPIGEGIELTKVTSSCKYGNKRFKRFEN